VTSSHALSAETGRLAIGFADQVGFDHSSSNDDEVDDESVVGDAATVAVSCGRGMTGVLTEK
jgi:hypothetical protein